MNVIGNKKYYHCSPTETLPFFLPLPPLLLVESNLCGEKCWRSTVGLDPVAIRSAMAKPLAGAHSIPQHYQMEEIRQGEKNESQKDNSMDKFENQKKRTKRRRTLCPALT